MLTWRCFPLAAMAAALWAQTPPGFRLPDTVAPLRYDLDLNISPASEDFTGTVRIAVRMRDTVKTVWLHGEDIEAGEVTVETAGKRIAAHTVKAGRDSLGIVLDEPAGPGEATIRISYRGKISRSSSDGLFLNRDNGELYVYSQFEPVSARRAFPCFDEPRFKTPWRLTLHVPKGNRAFANTPVESETEEPGGTVAVRFAESRPLPSYLVALAVGPIETVDAGCAGANQVPVRILVPRGRTAEAAFAAKVTSEIVNRLERYFGRPYPYAKLDSAAVPLVYGFGAMENAGLVTYAENLILAKPADSSAAFQRSYVMVAAHELAHQWFGDLVTMSWWDDTWLNEAFATWMEQRLVAEWKPEWKVPLDAVLSKQFAMAEDALISARRIRQPIAGPDDIANAFDAITYQKGAAVIRMFEQWVGPDRFQAGVRQYLTEHAWGNATAANFLRAVSAAAGRDVAPAFSTFLDQAGVPLISVSLRCASAGASLELTQRRFLPLGSAGSPVQSWQIPVCVRYGRSGSEARQCTLFSASSATVPLDGQGCPEWVEANAGEVGYYHSRYDPAVLDKLLAGGGKRLEPVERAGLLGDARALVRGGEWPAADALRMAREFAADPARQIVTASMNLVGSLENAIPEALAPRYAAFIRHAYGDRARSLGWVPRPGEDEDARLLRPALVGLVARDGEDRALGREARDLAQRWLAERSAVDAEVLRAVLGTAAQYGDAGLFERFLSAARAEKSRRDRQRLLYALSSFRDPKLARKALDLTLSPEFEPRESFFILFGPLAYPELRGLPFDFVRANYDALVARLPRGIGSDAGAMLPQVAGAFCSASRAGEVRTFFADRMRTVTGGPRILDQVIESIQVCAAVKDNQGPGIAEFLRRQ